MKHNGTKIRGMKVVCDRSWESMSPMDGGRFCDSCQKPVIDFTDWSRQELIAFFQQAPGTCGQFRPEQVDPSLLPIEEVGKHARRGFFATIAAFALHTDYAQQAPEPAPVEQVGTTPASDRRVKPGTDHITSHPRKSWDTCAPVKAQKPARKKRTGVYVSGRFPFIHVRSRTYRGRSVMGCPTF